MADGRSSEGKLQKLKDQEAVPAGGELKGADATTSGVKNARQGRKRGALARMARPKQRQAPVSKAKLRARAIFRYADGSFF
jgi:hypothetical protein